jgi:hypothetical protein
MITSRSSVSGVARTIDWRGLAITTLAAALLTTLLAWPVLRAPATQLFGVELVGRHHDPFTSIEQYAAGGVPAPVRQPATDLPGVALASAIDAVAAYNLLTLASFVLAAAIAYAHARHLIGSRLGAAIAALLFAFSPFHLAQSAYHVHIAQIQWVPLVFLSLWRLLEHPSVPRALIAAGALLLATAASAYLGFVSAVVSPVAVVAYAVASGRVARRAGAIAWGGAALAAAAAAGAAALAVWAPQLLRNPDAFGFPAYALDQHSARWWSYLIPPAAHPLFGETARALWGSRGIHDGLLEQQVSLGVGVLGLAIAALVLHRQAPSTDRPVPVVPLAILALFAALCSLPAIGLLLHPLAPMFRAYARFAVIVSLATTTLAGAGAVLLLRRGTRASRVAAVALLAIACVEYLPSTPAARDTLPTAAHRRLAGTPGAQVFDCTIATPGATAGIGFLMRAPVAFPAGIVGDCAEPEFGRKLAAFAFTHLIVRHDDVRGAWMRGRVPDGTQALGTFAEATAFAVTAPKPVVYVGELTGFHAREFRGGDSWRWMPKEGAIGLVNTGAGPRSTALDVELDAYDTDRVVRVDAAGAAPATLTVTRRREWHTIGPLAIGVGTTGVSLVADSAASPYDAHGEADRRPLSIRIHRWRVR